MALVRKQSDQARFGALLAMVRNIEETTRRLHEALWETRNRTEDPRRRATLELACAQTRTAHAAACATWRTLKPEVPVAEAAATHTPVNEL